MLALAVSTTLDAGNKTGLRNSLNLRNILNLRNSLNQYLPVFEFTVAALEVDFIL